MSVKVAVIGGGSTYTPELVSGLSGERERLDVGELWLVDPDRERREVVGGLAARMLAAQGFDGRLEVTDELDRALDGADVVLLQLRVGGQRARLSDETVPLRCGCIGQETTGAGGFAKALRTIPVVLEIAERARELAGPDAWIVDFTNPVGIVVRALLDAGHRAIGLCNVAIGFQREIAAIYEVTPEQVMVEQVGLNHLTWIRRVTVGGDDVLGDLLEHHAERMEGQTGLPASLMRLLGVLPSYYLRYFYMQDAVIAEQLVEPPRAQVVAEIERELLALYRDERLVKQARGAREARRRVLQRGCDPARGLAARRHGRRPGRRRPRRWRARRVRRRRRARAAGADRPARAPNRSRSRRSLRSCWGSPAT